MQSVKQYAKTVEKFTVDNSPAILTGIGVAGTVTTAVLTHKAATKAESILREVPPDPELKERLTLTWKCYIPPVAVGTATVVCIVGANRVGTRRAAAMAAAYTLSEKAYDEYRDKVTEKFGETKAKAVKDEVAQDRVTKNPPNNSVVITSGKVLCHEEYTGRYFESSMEIVKGSVNELNQRILSDGYASVNDFYDQIGLPRTSMGEELGWLCGGDLVELDISTAIAPDGRPCLSFDFSTLPIRNYYRNN